MGECESIGRALRAALGNRRRFRCRGPPASRTRARKHTGAQTEAKAPAGEGARWRATASEEHVGGGGGGGRRGRARQSRAGGRVLSRPLSCLTGGRRQPASPPASRPCDPEIARQRRRVSIAQSLPGERSLQRGPAVSVGGCDPPGTLSCGRVEYAPTSCYGKRAVAASNVIAMLFNYVRPLGFTVPTCRKGVARALQLPSPPAMHRISCVRIDASLPPKRRAMAEWPSGGATVVESPTRGCTCCLRAASRRLQLNGKAW